MVQLTLQNFDTLVQNEAAAAQASSDTPLNLDVGSVIRAIFEADASQALWLQYLILLVLGVTRLATSTGSDVDSFGADFGFTRLPAVAASGNVTFSRYSTTQAGFIPVYVPASGSAPASGAQVMTADGTQTFNVTADPTNPNYVASPVAGYNVPIGTSSITVPVQAENSGTQGNVLAGTISLIVGGIAGIDTATNAASFTNGINAESDSAFKARFVVWLQGLASSDKAAIESAIQGVQQGLTYLLVENYDYPGTTPDDGNFFVVINDGSGSPPSSLLTLVENAVNAIRGFTIRFQGAYAPTLVTPTISLSVRSASGYSSAVAEANAAAAVLAAVNATPLDNLWLYTSAIEAAAMGAEGVAAVQPGSTKINGANADLALTLVQLPSVTLSNITVSSY